METAVDSTALARWAAEAHRLGYMEELLEFHVTPHALPPSQIFGSDASNANDFVDIEGFADNDGNGTSSIDPRDMGQYPHTSGSLGSTPPASPLPSLSAAAAEPDFHFDLPALSAAISSAQSPRTAGGPITTHTCLAHGRVFNILPRQHSTDSGIHLELTPQDMLDLALNNLYSGSAFPGDMPGIDGANGITAAALKSAVDQQNALDSICAQLGGGGLHGHTPMGLEHVATSGGKSSLNACHNCGTATTTMWRRNKEGAHHIGGAAAGSSHVFKKVDHFRLFRVLSISSRLVCSMAACISHAVLDR